MKLKTIFLTLAALCAAACSDDDKTVTPAESVSGTYEGALTLSVMGNSQGDVAMNVVVEPETASTVSVTLSGDPEATGGMTIKTIRLTGVSVSAEEGTTHTLSKSIGGEGYVAQDSGTSVNWKFSEITGTVTDNAATLHLVGQPGAMPMAITMDFTGTK